MRYAGSTRSSFEVLGSQSSSGNMTPVKNAFSFQKSNSWEKRVRLESEWEIGAPGSLQSWVWVNGMGNESSGEK